MHAIVATGIKGVCHHNLVCKADQWGCFTLRSSGKLYLLKYTSNATTHADLSEVSVLLVSREHPLDETSSAGTVNPAHTWLPTFAGGFGMKPIILIPTEAL